ncbi:MAG TPA: CAP domain-containing protein [Thermoleophilaceae bacterium]
MRKHIAVLCVGLAGIASASLGAASASAAATDRAERALVEKINRVRADHGLRQLELSPSLARSAGRYSWSQMHRGYFGHAPRIQASSRYRTLGEILAIHAGANPLIGFTVSGWMHSAVHTEVVTYDRFRYIGAGRAVGHFGAWGRTTLWTVQFGN